VKAESPRSLAKVAGARLYWTGLPCPKGHIADRYTSNGTCATCLKESVARKVESGYFARHYAENAPAILGRQKEYSRKNSKTISERSAAWARENPKMRRIIAQQYKAKRRSQEGCGIDAKTLWAWISEQPKVCFYCRGEPLAKFHVDHFYPLSKGGAHVLTNLRIACPDCNLRKSASDPMRWSDKMLEAS
jgi:5-methylcytosine-specific restriction endonuclease McrA